MKFWVRWSAGLGVFVLGMLSIQFPQVGIVLGALAGLIISTVLV